MSNNQVYVITGATGWLGRECLELLIHKGVSPNNIYLFASKKQMLKMPFGDFSVYPIDAMKDYLLITPVVFHFAYLTRDKVTTLGRHTYTDACLKITSVITEALKKWLGATLCYASSGAVYDNQYKADYFENNPYGFLKFMDECYFKELCNSIGSRLIIPRIFNISGRHTQNRSQYALTSMIDQAQASQVIHISAKHKVIRSYISAQQLIEVCLLWINDSNDNNFIRFDACSSEAIEITQIAECIKKNKGFSIDIKRDTDNSLEDSIYLGDPKAMSDLCQKYEIKLLSSDEQIQELI